jgi:hypothetical protein
MAQKIWMNRGASRGFEAKIAKAVLAAADKLLQQRGRSAHSII